MPRNRSRQSPLLELVQESSQPVYAVDEQRRIVFGNAACEQWTGHAMTDLLEVRCDYHSDQAALSGAALTAAALCPPPEVFTGQRRRSTINLVTPSGGASTRGAEFIPVSNEARQVAGVLVMVDAEESVAAALPGTADPPDDTQWHSQLQRLRQELGSWYRPDQLIGTGPAARRVRDQVRCAMAGEARVLIVGPPGSGREHVARTIFYGHDSAAAPLLIAQACPLIDPEMLQTTLKAFLRQQHEATSGRPPSLLLLDVDGLSEDAQIELAGFLQLPKIDVRTLATARTDLLELARAGKFRADLAYLLSTLVIQLPTLQERSADLPLLAQFFLEQQNTAGGRQLSGFTPDALDLLVAYPWPRNLDELAEVVDQAVRRAESPWITASDLPLHLRVAGTARPARGDEKIQLDEFLVDIERQIVQRALKRAKGNKTKAAKLLGINRARLLRRLGQLGLESETPVPFRPLDPENEQRSAPTREPPPDCQS